MGVALTFVATCLELEDEVSKVMDSHAQFQPSATSVSLPDIEGARNEVYPTSIFPFSKSIITISSYVSHLFLKYTIVSSLPRLPIIEDQYASAGYAKVSKAEVEYTFWLLQDKPHLECHLTSGQRRFFTAGHIFSVDAYDAVSRTVYEFYGCLFHGCACARAKATNSHGIRVSEAREMTRWRKQLLRALPEVENFVEMWHCTWEKIKKDNPAVQHACQDFREGEIFERADMRETYRGGVAEVFALSFNTLKVKDVVGALCPDQSTEHIEASLVDYNSMYPSCLLSREHTAFFPKEEDLLKIPVGTASTLLTHNVCMRSCSAEECCIDPREHDTEEECRQSCFLTCRQHCPPVWKWSQVPGLALVTIEPPRHNRFPILRTKFKSGHAEVSAGVLCRSCYEEAGGFSEVKECNHSSDQRALTGTFLFQELVYALQVQGYVLKRVHEVMFWPEYNQGGLDSLLGTFAKMKVTSGIDNVDDLSEEEKIELAEKLSKETGFKIESYDLINNGAMKQVAKTALCSLIGKCQKLLVIK